MIADGQSSIDALTLETEAGVSLRNWDDYQYTDDYSAPYPQWSFRAAPQYLGARKTAPSTLTPGSTVKVKVNGSPLCVGRVDELSLESSAESGLAIRVQGRDILGPVDDACADPAIKWTDNTTLLDVLLQVLAPFGITKIGNGAELDLYLTTGRAKPTVSKTTVQASVPGPLGFSVASGVTETVSGLPALQKIQISAIKPKIGEGNKEILDRVLKRFGLYLRALADGSGVVVTTPKFDQSPLYKIVHTAGTSNVLKSSYVDRGYNQPCAVVCLAGKAGSNGGSKTVGIAVNELAAYDSRGQQTAMTQAVLNRYKHAKVAPIRQVLVIAGKSNKYASSRGAYFFESGEAKNLDQAVFSAKRELARLQSQSAELKYTVLGFSQGGIPWSLNTIVDVQDEVLGVFGPWWVKSRRFSKTSGGGTTTELTLIRPYTMEF